MYTVKLKTQTLNEAISVIHLSVSAETLLSKYYMQNTRTDAHMEQPRKQIKENESWSFLVIVRDKPHNVFTASFSVTRHPAASQLLLKQGPGVNVSITGIEIHYCFHQNIQSVIIMFSRKARSYAPILITH